jgi:putative hydrolase of the HAD superfamily
MRHLLLDLDHTLYPPDNGLLDEIHRRMESFVAEALGVSPAEASRIRDDFRRRHGTTMRGLAREHRIEPDRFLRAVHDGLPGPFLRPDPDLLSALASCGMPVHIFSNAPGDYVRRAVRLLGLEAHVDRLFDLESSGYEGKPHDAAYRVVEEALGVPPSDLLFLDDSLDNVRSARARGWEALWVSHGRRTEGVEAVDDLSVFLGGLKAATP